MKRLALLALFAISALVIAGLAADPQQFTGVITDDMCADSDHSRMRMGPTNAECSRACNEEHGASFVLYDGAKIYTLSDQKNAQKFAGEKVTITGTLDTGKGTIQVDSIAPAK